MGSQKVPWPEFVEVLRVFVLPFAWVFTMATVSLSRIHALHWSVSLGFAVVSMLPAGLVMAVFIR